MFFRGHLRGTRSGDPSSSELKPEYSTRGASGRTRSSNNVRLLAREQQPRQEVQLDEQA